ncbi:hypothetical protein BDQ12DRAFT_679017 [Crucibulum laeve]|uniref:GRAM domain-containing protein n=1 Tax=Crucibulum laeve TaxID=68775 RepID=A0A5C3MIZ0_9AGAR|nr:hypothetical protein BDQ12DRAFT_679017 [Crucibulum laeve]
MMSLQGPSDTLRSPPPLPPRPGGLRPSSPLPRPTSAQSSDFRDDERSSRLSPTIENDTVSDDEAGMSEQQLRQLYDDEEIERFLNLFSAYVTEVRLPETPETDLNPPGPLYSAASLSQLVLGDGSGEDTNSVNKSLESLHSESETIQLLKRSLAEEIAFRYVMPNLPSPRPRPPFTIGRLRLTTQRLYLAAEPVYLHFFDRMAKLATWKDRNKSLMYCTLFWTLWWYNLLLPALVMRIFCSLARRKLFPYPTLNELREHRQEIIRANEFGEQVSARLDTTSTFGMKEMWRLFKLFNKSKKNKVKAFAKDTGRDQATEGLETDEDDGALHEDTTVLENASDGKEATDLKRVALHSMNEVADLHERVRNIFIWRRPASSRIYAMAIFFIFVATLVLPAQYLSKLTYFVLGSFYWHIIPIIAALPAEDRARLPPAFSDVPTDADYAMELISQRVAAGLDITPLKSNKNKNKSSKQQHSRSRTLDLDSDVDSIRSIRTNHKQSKSEDGKAKAPIDWKKWGDRLAVGKALADGGKRLMIGKHNSESDFSTDSLASRAHIFSPGQFETITETHTYPAQHSSAPGLITVTNTTLFFTPIISQDPKLIVPLSSIKGVKKTGMLKGLNISWNETSTDGTKVQNEEKFLWVGDRDELFARLVSTEGGKRWLNV